MADEHEVVRAGKVLAEQAQFAQAIGGHEVGVVNDGDKHLADAVEGHVNWLLRTFLWSYFFQNWRRKNPGFLASAVVKSWGEFGVRSGRARKSRPSVGNGRIKGGVETWPQGRRTPVESFVAAFWS